MSIQSAEIFAFRRQVAGGTRDPGLQPFATNSPWNYPLGSGTAWRPIATAGPTGWHPNINFDINNPFWVPSTNDPLQDIFLFNPSGTDFKRTYNIPLRASQSFPLGSGVGDKNMVFFRGDHLTLIDGNDSGFPSGYGWNGARHPNAWFLTSYGAEIDATGPGHARGSNPMFIPGSPSLVPGNPGGSSATGVSQTAGIIRQGELVNGIPHTLFSLFSFFNLADPGGGHFVWPANGLDSPSPTFVTWNTVYYGSVLGVPPTSIQVAYGGHPIISPSSMRTVEGRNLLTCLMNYGSIICDSADGYYFRLNTVDALVELPAFNQTQTNPAYTGASSQAAFQADLGDIQAQLQIVDNSYHHATLGPPAGYPNDSSLGIRVDGGDGALPVPVASAFAPQFGGGNGKP